MSRQYSCGAILGREIIGLCGWLHETQEDFRKEYGKQMKLSDLNHQFEQSTTCPDACIVCGKLPSDWIHQVVDEAQPGNIYWITACVVCGKAKFMIGLVCRKCRGVKKEYEKAMKKHGFVESNNTGYCFCGKLAADPIHQVGEARLATPCDICGKPRPAGEPVYFAPRYYELKSVCKSCYELASLEPAPSSSIAESIIRHASGKVSSRIPPFHLIPRAALVAGALRFAKGIRVKKEGAWNAVNGLAEHNKVMEDTQFIIDRLGHCIDHAYLAIARLQGLLPYDPEDEVDGGDAGAIFFASALLACRREWERQK